jgi:hypothetical protein
MEVGVKGNKGRGILGLGLLSGITDHQMVMAPGEDQELLRPHFPQGEVVAEEMVRLAGLVATSTIPDWEVKEATK